MLSLDTKKIITSDLQLGGNAVFYKDYLIYTSYNILPSIPWGGGEATKVSYYKIKTGENSVLFESDEWNLYRVERLEGNILYINHSFVEKGSNWGEDNSTLLRINLDEKLP